MGFPKGGLEIAAHLYMHKEGLTLDELILKTKELFNVQDEDSLKEHIEFGHHRHTHKDINVHEYVLAHLLGFKYRHFDNINDLYKFYDINTAEGMIYFGRSSFYWKKSGSKYYLDEEKTYESCSFSLSEDLVSYQNGKKLFEECKFGFNDMVVYSFFLKNNEYSLLNRGKISEYKKFFETHPEIIPQLQQISIDWIKKYRPQEIPKGNTQEIQKILNQRVIDAEFILRVIDRNVKGETR